MRLLRFFNVKSTAQNHLARNTTGALTPDYFTPNPVFFLGGHGRSLEKQGSLGAQSLAVESDRFRLKSWIFPLSNSVTFDKILIITKIEFSDL